MMMYISELGAFRLSFEGGHKLIVMDGFGSF
jgi:hypothetical protein